MIQAMGLPAVCDVFGLEALEVEARDGLRLTVRRGPDGRYELTVGRDGGQARTEAWGCAVRVSDRVAALGGNLAASQLGALRYVG